MTTTEPTESHKGIMQNFLSNVSTALEASPEPRKEPSGKTPAGQRPAELAPASEPVVGDDPTVEKTGEPVQHAAGDDKAGVVPPPEKKAPEKAKPEPIKATEDKEDDYLTAPQPKDKKGWEKWTTNRKEKETALKAQIKERDTKLTELQTRLTEVESKASSTEPPLEIKTKLDALEAENKALQEKVLILDVEQDDRFKAYFQKPVDNAIAEAKMIVGEAKADQIEKLLKMPDNEYRKALLDEFTADLEDDGAKMDIRGIVRDLRKVDRDKGEELKKAREHGATLKAQKEAAVTAQAAKARALQEQAFKDTVKELTDPQKGNVMFQMREGHDEWNQGVLKRMEEAKSLLTSNDLSPNVVIKHAHNAVAYPAVVQAYINDSKAWKDKEAQYEAQIASLKKAQPKGGQTAKPENQNGMEISRNMKPHQIVKEFGRSIAEKFGG